jgi:hypothetical protein
LLSQSFLLFEDLFVLFEKGISVSAADEMKVRELQIPLVDHLETQLELYFHQAQMLDEWERHETSVSHLMTLKDHKGSEG